jgi:hypothetical protein
MAAFLEQILRMGFLKVTAADLARRDVSGDGENRRARAVRVEQAIDQMQVARAAGTRTYRWMMP